MAYQRVQDLALYTKIHDLALWLFPHIKNFPRAERDVVFAYNAAGGPGSRIWSMPTLITCAGPFGAKPERSWGYDYPVSEREWRHRRL